MFRNPQTQPNGLEKVYLGEFEQDPSADYIVDVVKKFNYDVDLLDLEVGNIRKLQQEMAILAGRGLLDGYLYGGVCGSMPPEEECDALIIDTMFVTDENLPQTPPDPPNMILYNPCEPYITPP